MTSTKPVADDRLVPKEGVLHAGLSMVPRLLLPLAAPEILHPHDCAIARTRRGASPSRSRRRLYRWNDDCGAACCCGLVDRDRVIGCVSREACNVRPKSIDEIEGSLRVVRTPVSQGLCNDQSRSLDTEMEFLPGALSASSMLHCRPFAFADDGQPCAIDD